MRADLCCRDGAPEPEEEEEERFRFRFRSDDPRLLPCQLSPAPGATRGQDKTRSMDNADVSLA